MNRFIGATLFFLSALSVQALTGRARADEPVPTSQNEGEASANKDNPQILVCTRCEALDTRISGRLTSEVYLIQRSKARILGDGVYSVEKLNTIPFYETVELRADEIYHKGLSVHFQGWTGLDLNDVYFDDRFKRVVGDPTYLYVKFQDSGFNGTLGRQLVYSGTARGLHIDGIDASYELPFHLGIEALAGLVVSPYLGPDWYREQPEVDFDSFGPGFSDWERKDDYAIGGRIYYQRLGLISGGVSALHVTETDETSQQLLGANCMVTPIDWFAAHVETAFDLPTESIQQIGAEIDFYPLSLLSFSVDYDFTDPSLFLSHTSIFSIFSSEQYHSVGGTAHIRPLDWLRANLGFHRHLYDYVDSATQDGSELSAGVSFKYLEQREGTILIHYKRLSEPENGLHEFRTRITVPFAITGLKAVSNLYLDVYDRRISQQKLGYLGDIGLFYLVGLFTAGGNVSAGKTPYHEDEIRAMLKFAYNFEQSFMERAKL